MPKDPLDLTEAEVRAAAAERRTRKVSPFEITEAEALAATGRRVRGLPVEHDGSSTEPAPSPPKYPGPYSHGDHGVLESDNQDKPYIERRFDLVLDGAWASQEAIEAAERRR